MSIQPEILLAIFCNIFYTNATAVSAVSGKHTIQSIEKFAYPWQYALTFRCGQTNFLVD